VNSNVHNRLAQLYQKMGRTSDADREMEIIEKLEKSKAQIRAVYREMHQQSREEQTINSDTQQ
jgi:hypothetical protein